MHRPRRARVLSACLAVGLCAGGLLAQGAFVNFETPHVHPLELTPDGSRLLAVNTAANRLEVWNAEGPALVHLRSIPVGLDPVSVRAFDDDTAWVVNHVSDSVSLVDLASGRVTATVSTEDEPCDVVFAGTAGLGGARAFVSCSAVNLVQVFDPADLDAAPVSVDVFGEDPRMLAVSPDGSTVYAAIFESGNGTTVLGGGSTVGGGFPPNVVSLNSSPYGGTNPPPNDGASFDPPLNEPNPPEVGMIVRKNGAGEWFDDNGGNWTDFVSGPDADESGRPVGWDLPDHDVAVLDADSLAVSYVDQLMNIDMALAVNPVDGRLAVVGTEATNEVRFEPVLEGTFVRVHLAVVDVGTSSSVVDLNPHLDYTTGTLPQPLRDESLGDPRGVAWNAIGTRAYVTGMGSNNVIVVDAGGNRVGLAPTIEVGEGPTGVVVQHAQDRLFVLNRFDGTISVVDTITETETAQVAFFDPTPDAIRDGRVFLYGTHETSGLGQTACGSCHVDSRFDRLAWDLGDPSGSNKSTSGQNLNAGLPLGGSFPDWHPMKGPMTTQTLQDIIGKEPHHWRGDRTGIEEFNPAFEGLLGDDTQLTASEMQQFEDFLATISFPPNPFRELDNSLPTALPLEGHFTSGRFGPAGLPLGVGNAQTGLALYRPPNLLDSQGVACVTCHTLPTGMGPDMFATGFFFQPLPPGPNGERHHALTNVDGSTNVSLKIPQLRNLYDKVGMEFNTTENTAGFGFLHDGSVDSLARFVSEPIFSVASDQEVADLVAFMLAFSGSDLPAGSTALVNLEPPGTPSQDVHAAVGLQVTLDGSDPAAALNVLDDLEAFADGGNVGLVAHGYRGGLARGFAYTGSGSWQSDRAGETESSNGLRAGVGPGQELTFTVTPWGSENRLGVDADEDGALDRDELDAGSDPGDPLSLPGACTPAGTDLGYAKAGGDGRFPVLRSCGSLDSGQTADLVLSDAAPSAQAWLVASLVAGFLPFQGGTLVPLPDILLGPALTDGTGGLAIPVIAGGGGPADLFVQWVVQDPGAVAGRSHSNALALHFGP